MVQKISFTYIESLTEDILSPVRTHETEEHTFPAVEQEKELIMNEHF